MRSELQTHKGQAYFYCNYANLSIEDLQIEMDAVDEFIAKQPENSLLVLTDVRGLIGSPTVVAMFKKSTAHTKKFIRRSAVIGIGLTGPKKALFDIVMRFSGQSTVIFEEIEKAKDYLVEK